jgi:hypothetical protein
VGRRTTVVRSDDLTWGLHWTTSAKYDAKVRGKRRARVLVARTHLNPLRPRLDSTARRSDLLVEARRPRVWRREEPGAARRLGDDDERHFSGRLVDRRDWRLGLESSALRENDKKGPFAFRPPDSRAPTPPSGLTGAMGDFGEGPLGTKLGQGATAVKYPRPTRVKNKTPAPTQVRPRAAARRAFSSRLLEISLLPRLERVSPPAMIDAR